MRLKKKKTEALLMYLICTDLLNLLGIISAHEWRKTGVQVLTRDDEEIRVHPRYGVFSPIRGEYIELVLKAPCLQRYKIIQLLSISVSVRGFCRLF